MDDSLLTSQEIGKFDQRQDGVYLSVSSAQREKYSFDDIRMEIIRKGVVNADFGLIHKIWEEASGKAVKIANYFERYDAIKDKYIEVSVSDSQMEAYLSLRVPEGIDQISVNDVLYKLLEVGVEKGIDEQMIDRLIKARQPVHKAVVARGRPREDGRDAEIRMSIDTDETPKPLIMEDGSVDFKNINLIKIVDKDQLLAIKSPATPGEKGFTVTGRFLEPRPGNDVPLPRGKNTHFSDDGLQLFSSLIGNVYLSDGMMQVENIYVVKGNVDFSTGNISYPGDVVINGDVKADFSVHTEGNIIVRGTVEAGEIVSTGGNIDIKKGIIGTQKDKKAKIVAEGTLKALFIQEAVISAGKDIEVGSYILNSSVHAENEVRALRGRGMIVGSTVFSGSCVRAKNIGSMSDTRTTIKVGRIVKDEVNVKFQQLEDELKVLEEEDKLLHKRLDFLDLLKKRLPHFPPEKEKELTDLLEKLKILEIIKQETIQDKEDFHNKFVDQFDKERKIYVLQKLWPGVLLGINDVVRKVDASQRRVMAVLEEGQIELKRLALKEATGGLSDMEDEEDEE